MEGILTMRINIFLLDHNLKGLSSLFGIILGWNRLAQFALCTLVSGGKPCTGEKREGASPQSSCAW